MKLAKKERLRTRYLNVFHAQNIHCDLLEIAEQPDIVLNSGLGKRAVIAGEQRSCLCFGVGRLN